MLMAALALGIKAQGEAPGLEYVMELKVRCEGAYQVGQTAHGNRFVIPIVGGTFEGPRLKGTILSGGADYQLQDTLHGRTELEAIYSIRTDDGTNIHVRNRGLLCTGKAPDGSGTFYFRTVPQFEAPQDSPYNWLNDAIFICQPSVGHPDGLIRLKIWKVL